MSYNLSSGRFIENLRQFNEMERTPPRNGKNNNEDMQAVQEALRDMAGQLAETRARERRMQELMEGLANRVGELQNVIERQKRHNEDEEEGEDEEEDEEEDERPPPRGGRRLTDAQLYRDILKLYKEVAPSECKSSNIKAYLEAVQTLFEIYEDERRAPRLILKIVFCKIDDLSTADKAICVDFTSLKKVLLEKYSKLRDIQAIERDFTDHQMKGSDYASYELRFKRLIDDYQRAKERQFEEEDLQPSAASIRAEFTRLKQHFLAGLPTELKASIAEGVTTLNELYRDAEAAHQTTKYLVEKKIFNDKGVKPGSKFENFNKKNNFSRDSNAKENAPNASRAPKGGIKCFKCHAPGHKSPDCPENKNSAPLNSKNYNDSVLEMHMMKSTHGITNLLTVSIFINSFSIDFLVDLGPRVTCIKGSKIPACQESEVRLLEKPIIISGLGKIRIFNEITLSLLGTFHTFLVIEPEYEGKFGRCDGLIGIDFLEKFQAVIDVKKRRIDVNINDRVGWLECKSSNATSQSWTARVDEGLIECDISALIPDENANIDLDVEEIDGFSVYDFEAEVRTAIVDRASRVESLSKLLNFNLRNVDEKQVADICNAFSHAFFLKGDTLSPNKEFSHKITLKDPSLKPINEKPFPFPYKLKRELESILEKMIDEDLIEEYKGETAWNFPSFLVEKPMKADRKRSWRLVCDMRKMNSLVDQISYPIPRMEEIYSQLGDATVYSVVDLYNGFWQLPLEEESRKFCVFAALNKKYAYKRLVQGLKNAPAHYTRVMATALKDLIGQGVLVYFDDLIVFGKNIEEHNISLRRMLERLIQHGLKIKPDKCQFLKREILFLGNRITPEGIFPDNTKFEKLEKWPTPTDRKKVQEFLGFCNFYRKFIRGFSIIAKPLSILTSPAVQFHWTEEAQSAFEQLKKALLASNVLVHPDFEKEFFLEVDASGKGLGAILSQ